MTIWVRPLFFWVSVLSCLPFQTDHLCSTKNDTTQRVICGRRKLQLPAYSFPDIATLSQSDCFWYYGSCLRHGASTSSQLEVPRLHSRPRTLQRSEGGSTGKKKIVSYIAVRSGNFAQACLRPQLKEFCTLSIPSEANGRRSVTSLVSVGVLEFFYSLSQR